MSESSLVPMERIERAILVLRGHRVMLDADLAALYQVETKTLVRAIKRNIERFPADFMFRLSEDEFENLRRQSGTSSSWGGRRYFPYASTEQGVAMLSGVLRSPPRGAGQHRDHARVRAPSTNASGQRGSGEEARRSREEVRRAVPRRVRCHPRADGIARQGWEAHRVSIGGHVKTRVTSPPAGDQPVEQWESADPASSAIGLAQFAEHPRASQH